MVLLHGGANGFGIDDMILVALGIVMLGGALWGLWQAKRHPTPGQDE